MLLELLLALAVIFGNPEFLFKTTLFEPIRAAQPATPAAFMRENPFGLASRIPKVSNCFIISFVKLVKFELSYEESSIVQFPISVF